MIKQHGDKKVQDWTHPRSGLETCIYLRGTQFVATLLEEEFRAPDVAMLRKKLSDKAEHWIEMDWYPIIEVRIGEAGRHYRDDGEGESIEFSRSRFFISQSPAGEIFKCEWEVAPSHRKARMDSYGNAKDIKLIGLPLDAPLKIEARYSDGGKYLIDYNEALWVEFDRITENIFRLKKRLKEIVSTNQGLTFLLESAGSDVLQLQDAKTKNATRPKR